LSSLFGVTRAASGAQAEYEINDDAILCPLAYLTSTDHSMSDDSNNTTAGGRSLGGGAAEPLPTSWSHPSERPRVGRIGDWSSRGGGSGGGGGGPHDDDDDDEDENEERESWFAGGERRYQRMTSLEI
jgi:hypothetical protein